MVLRRLTGYRCCTDLIGIMMRHTWPSRHSAAAEHARAMTMIMLSFASVMITAILSGLSTRISKAIVSTCS